MRAVTWHGRRDVRVDAVDDPTIEAPTDAIIRITTSGLCGSDLHLYARDVTVDKTYNRAGHAVIPERLDQLAAQEVGARWRRRRLQRAAERKGSQRGLFVVGHQWPLLHSGAVRSTFRREKGTIGFVR